MRPYEIFAQYQDNKIDRSSAISALKSFLENSSDDDIRIDALKYLGLVIPKSIESFKYFEQLLLSDSDDWIRGTAAELIINDYLEEGEKVLKWVINNESSITECLTKIFKSLNADTRKEAKLLITFIEQTLERRFSDLKIYKREEIGLGRLERLMGKIQDYLLYIDDLFYLRKDQIYNILVEIKELIRDTKLEQIDPKYAKVLRTIGEFYSPLQHTDDDLRQALIAYKLSLRIDPDNEETWLLLAFCYGSLNEFDNAIQVYKRALEINPSFEKIGNRLASLYNSLDEYEGEKETYE